MGEQPKSAFIDIKQRAILTGQTSNGLVMCAEPSPDALSSLSSELATDLKYKELLQATLSLSQQEAASFVGLRTQTIQLLRDGMYRLCESYLAGALTKADYAWLMRRYQKYMVALLTIEQLTRVAQAPAVAQAGQGLASASRSATAIQADLEEIDKTLTRLGGEKKKLDAEKAEVDKLDEKDPSRASKLSDVTKRLESNGAAIKRAEEVRAALLEGLKSAKGVLASGSTTVQVIADGQDTRSSSSGDAVATAIAGIANSVLNQDDLGTLCFQVLEGGRSGNLSSELKSSCAQMLQANAAVDAAKAELWKKLVSAIEVDLTRNPDKALSLLAALSKSAEEVPTPTKPKSIIE